MVSAAGADDRIGGVGRAAIAADTGVFVFAGNGRLPLAGSAVIRRMGTMAELFVTGPVMRGAAERAYRHVILREKRLPADGTGGFRIIRHNEPVRFFSRARNAPGPGLEWLAASRACESRYREKNSRRYWERKMHRYAEVPSPNVTPPDVKTF